MDCSRSRRSREWAAAIWSARSRRSGCAGGPGPRRTSGVARRSRSARRGRCRSTPTVRSPAASRSPQGVAQARYACTRELSGDIQPRAHVDAEAAERARDLSLPKRPQQAFRSGEGRDLDVRAADLDGPVRVAADAAGEVVTTCEIERANVAGRRDLPRVEDLDDVERRSDALEHPVPQVPAAVPAEGVRDVGESALLVDERDRPLSGEAALDPPFEKEPDELSIRRGDLFSDDHHEAGVHLAKTEGTLDRVVVGHAHRRESRAAGEPGEISEPNAAVQRVLGVHVHVEAQAIHTSRRRTGHAGSELGKAVEGVTEVAEREEAEERKTDEEREDPEQERGVPYVGAVVPNAFRGSLLLHRLRDRGEELLVRLRLREPLNEQLGALDLTHRGEHLAQQDDLTHDVGCEEHLLPARAR